MCVQVRGGEKEGGREKTTCKVQFSPSSIWVLGIELRSSGLVAATSPHCAVLKNPNFISPHRCLHPCMNHRYQVSNLNPFK